MTKIDPKNIVLTPEEIKLRDELDAVIERDDWKPLEGEARKKMLRESQLAAKNYLANKKKKKKSINLRIAESDLEKLKTLAMHEGIPYQTLLGSIIHLGIKQRRKMHEMDFSPNG